ncbi:hypothetical protein [Chryseobacterium sp. MP_3.2]|uniref:hypothetical protein n=1 Tax=Chryseobacterium sp. MP_3.2 TaxID=3071712 RepID=UPI002E01516D|nr:hypothetical protein [Chryseobacterium sp. MP_3.2]
MIFQETKESKAIWYDEKLTVFPVYQIPLESIIYNKYNGRIKSAILSYESGRGKKLDPKNPDDKKIIENYLFESAENRNEKTLQSLKNYGQQEIGIVTKDLIVIDGNRRSSLLNKLFREGHDVDYFKAIILPDDLENNVIEIIKLETNYQMGVDNKVEYKPIEKYLRCKELIEEYSVPIDEVAKLMAEKSTRIIQWMSILSLMEEYLFYLDSPNVYTRLDKKEGHFVDLNNYLKQTNNNAELKEVYFDFIRLGLPVQRIRVIGNPKDNLSLFANSGLWKPFYAEHISIKRTLIETKFQEVKNDNPEMSNEQIFGNIDSFFKEHLFKELVNNFVQGEIAIKELKIKVSVKIELQKIYNFIVKINTSELYDIDKEDIKILLNSIWKESQSKENLL